MIVGIDIGTQSLKAVVTDDGLQPLGEASTAYRPSFPRPGWAEQNPALWEAALGPTIGQALESAGRTAGDVRALGIAGQLDGCIATDAEARPLHPCLIWMDRRAEAEIRDLPADLVRARTGVVLDPSHMAAKIRWLRRHVPEARRARRFHQPVSWLVARLTGNHVLDHGVASTTMAYALAERRLDPALLALFDLDADDFPALAEAHAPAGGLHREGAALTGLPEGIPVAVGTGDDFSTPLGAGLAATGTLVCTLGTAEVVGALHEAPVIDPAGLVETHLYPGGLWFIENPGWLSGGAVTWAERILGLADAPALDRLAAEAPPGADGVTFLPALSGAMAPEWIAAARGCFYGLAAAHGQSHLARAVLEGCAFAMRDVLERLLALGVAAHEILLLGGGAKSRLWAQIRADLTGLPVAVPRLAAASPMGAAVLAAVAGGIVPDLATAAAAVRGERTVMAPDLGARPAYDAAYAAYRRLFESLRPMYGAAP